MELDDSPVAHDFTSNLFRNWGKKKINHRVWIFLRKEKQRNGIIFYWASLAFFPRFSNDKLYKGVTYHWRLGLGARFIHVYVSHWSVIIQIEGDVSFGIRRALSFDLKHKQGTSVPNGRVFGLTTLRVLEEKRLPLPNDSWTPEERDGMKNGRQTITHVLISRYKS